MTQISVYGLLMGGSVGGLKGVRGGRWTMTQAG